MIFYSLKVDDAEAKFAVTFNLNFPSNDYKTLCEIKCRTNSY